MVPTHSKSTNGGDEGVQIPRGRSSVPKVLSHHNNNDPANDSSLPPSHYNNAPLLSATHDDQAAMSNTDPETSEKRDSEKSPPPPDEEVVFIPRGKQPTESRASSLGSNRTGSEASTTILLDENLPQTETAAATIQEIKTLLDDAAREPREIGTTGERGNQQESEEVWKEDTEGPIKLKKKVRKEREAEEMARKEMMEKWGLKK